MKFEIQVTSVSSFSNGNERSFFDVGTSRKIEAGKVEKKGGVNTSCFSVKVPAGHVVFFPTYRVSFLYSVTQAAYRSVCHLRTVHVERF